MQPAPIADRVADPISPSPAPAPALARVPTGPRGLPLVGSLGAFARDPLGFVVRVAAEHGDLARFEVAGTPIFLATGPDLIKELLVDRHELCTKDQITSGLSRFLGHGLLTSEGATWKRQRKRAAPSFSRGDIGGYGEVMVDAADAMLARLQDDAVIDVHDELTATTLEIVVKTLFEADGTPDAERVGDTVTTLFEAYRGSFIGWQRLLPDWFPTATRRRFHRSGREMDALLAPILGAARARPAAPVGCPGLAEARDLGRADRAGGGRSLLARLAAAVDDEGKPMSDRELRDEVVTLFLAGHETTAITLTSALFLLAGAPEIHARAVAERDAVLGGRRATAADLARLPYLDAIVREANRLFPPAWIIGREATAAFTLGGAAIPAGAQILVSPWVVHRDARWFGDPEVFRPERWLGGAADGLPKYAYMPFGGGPRVCIGNHFAMLEAVLVLATLLGEVELAAVPTTRLAPEPAITLRPTGPVELQVRRRPGRTPAPRHPPGA